MQRAGFTLMELLVATALVALLLSVVVGVGSRYTRTMQHTQAHLGNLQALHGALTLLEEDIFSFQAALEGEPNRLRFMRTWPNSGASQRNSGLFDVVYEVRQENGAVHLWRALKDTRRVVADDDVFQTRLFSAENINFSYYDTKLNKLPVWLPMNGIPAGVELEITLSGKTYTRLLPVLVRGAND